MDHPQWYNNKLWNTTRQSIDGSISPKFKHIGGYQRSQSANSANNRRMLSTPIPTYTNNNNNDNVSYRIPMNSTSISHNRDRNIFNYQLPNRQNLKSAHPLRNNFYNKFYSSIPVQYNRPLVQNHNVSSSPILSLSGKTVPIKDNNNNNNKSIEIKINRSMLTPTYPETDNNTFNLLPTKNDIVKGNLNILNTSNIAENSQTKNEDEQEIDSTTEIKVPQNTPRIITESSQNKEDNTPIKSILKKTNSINTTYPLRNGFINIPVNDNRSTRVRTLSASSIPSSFNNNSNKSLYNMNSRINIPFQSYNNNNNNHIFSNNSISRSNCNINNIDENNGYNANSHSKMRNTLQSAPHKRGVRFDLSSIDVLEYPSQYH